MLSFVLLGSYFVASASMMKSSSLRMTMRNGKYESSGAIPVRDNEGMKSSLIKLVKAVPLAAAFSMVPEKASAKAPESPTSLGDDAYTELGNMKMCKILTGMWQVSGAHGYEPKKQSAINEMKHCAAEGFSTFDLADIYGPAEDYVGAFRKSAKSKDTAKDCQFFTKWVPQPGVMTQSMAAAAIDRSLRLMGTDSLDLLQFNWFPYQNLNYFDAMDHLVGLKAEGKIKNIGLTNFDTTHMQGLMDRGAPIVSNQIAYSVIDNRPQKKMAEFCTSKNVKLLCYGTLMGGFISSNWLNKPEPLIDSLTNVSLRKYLPWIKYWGGWDLFQEMLAVLDVIGKKHGVSLSNVAVRWVLDQPAVGGAIVGVRLGLKEHLEDNKKVFSFKLDSDDVSAIAAVQGKSKDLMTVFGDCGGEYRFRIRS